MVKRITASLLLVLAGAISILAQIDYNKQIKNLPSIAQGNMNSIRVVDGLKFSANAAGINAADADLGATSGEIWIPAPTFTATDAQISIGLKHTLKVFGNLTIDAVNKGPILLGNAAGLECASGNTAIQQTATGTFPSMIRAIAQDGSQAQNFIERCQFFGNTSNVTNGVIDATGFRQSWIRDVLINSFNSGWGIFIQDNQTGVLAGSYDVNIINDDIFANNTAGCLELLHSATASVSINNIDIQDLNCQGGASIASAPIVFQNTAAGAFLSQIFLTNTKIGGMPGTQPGITINGVLGFSSKAANCSGGSNCISIFNNAQNLAIGLDNINCVGCAASLFDAVHSYTNGNNYTNHYDFWSTSAGFTGGNIFASPMITGNFNNIRIVDGVRFAQSAAGINAADVDLGATAGEVWIPSGSIIATDAQISIRAAHTLKIFGQVTIDALNKGPILLGGTARIVCLGNFGAANILNTSAQTNIPSMVRLSTQDGSLGGMEIDGCRIDGAGSTVVNGVIDASGVVNGPSWIKDNLISGFASGWGITIVDIQSGALNGTNNVIISNNRIIGTGTGGCINVSHSATNSVTINGISILDLNCSAGTTSNNSIQIQNADATAAHMRQVYVSNVSFTSIPTGQTGLFIGGIQQAVIKGVTCNSGQNCVNLSSSANNGMITVDNVLTYSGNTALIDVASGITITTSGILHYEFPINNTGQSSYFPAVSYLKVQGLAPASCTSLVGFGTGATCAFDPGSTNNAGVMNITLGTTPAASGSGVLNFNTTQSNFGVNNPSCQWGPANGSGFWNGRAIIITGGTVSNATINFLWDNNAIALTTGIVKVSYTCIAK